MDLNSSGLTLSGPGNITVNGQVMQAPAAASADAATGSVTLAGPLTLSDNVAIVSATAGDMLTLSGPLNLGDYELSLTGPGSIVISGQISGSIYSSIDDDGTANLTLAADNSGSYEGTTTMDGGTLTVTVDGALGATDNTTNVESVRHARLPGPLDLHHR